MRKAPAFMICGLLAWTTDGHAAGTDSCPPWTHACNYADQDYFCAL